MKDFLLRVLGVSEELRKLRQKVDYQERWISAKMAQEKVKPEGDSDLQNALRVMQRRATRLMSAHPEIFKEFFSKESPK